MNKVELLAPAGDMACFFAAVNAGADAVYLGGEEYGARAYASNFSKEELCGAISHAHLFGVKVYLTVNTLVKERELEGLYTFLEPFYEMGLDGVIVQDMGVLRFIRSVFPDLPVHGSTQMCITGKYGARLLKEYGVSRVVPARELSLDELKEIKRETGMEIEAFIHGAMCYSYSGQCLFSSFLGGRSGNRGRCAGPCRLPYSVFNQKEVYPFSLKDMCTLPIIDRLIEAGIDSFKIEGRMKNPYYVAGVTSLYRKYIDLYEKSREENAPFEVEKKDLELLRRLYVRTDMETGYYHRHNGREMVTLYKPGYESGDEKQFLFLKEQFLDKNKKMELQCLLTAKEGEKMSLTLCNEKTIKAVFYGENPVQKALKRPVTEEDIKKQLLKTGNTPFHFSSVSVIMGKDVFIPLKEINELRRYALEQIRELYEKPYRRVCRNAALKKEQDAVEEQRNSYERKDCGIKRFCIGTVSEKQLKEVLSWIDEYASCKSAERNDDSSGTALYEGGFVLTAPDKSKAVLTAVEIDFSLLECGDAIKESIKRLSAKGISVYLSMPAVFRQAAEKYMDNCLTKEIMDLLKGYFCGSLDALEYIKERLAKAGISLKDKELAADHNLYALNHKAMSFLYDSGIRKFAVPYELNKYEWEEQRRGCFAKEFWKECSTEYLVYGHIPFMQTAGCVKKTFDRCDGRDGILYLTDRIGKKLPVMNRCGICLNTVYNSLPLFLYREMDEVICDEYRIAFTIEEPSKVRQILSCFLLREKPSDLEYTKGHFKKGIE